MTNNGEALLRQSSSRNSSSQPDRDRPDFLEIGDSVEHYGAGDPSELANDNNNDGNLANHNDPIVPNDLNQELLRAEENILDVDLDIEAGNPGVVDELVPSSMESVGFSQGSGFFAPASPTYSPSLPCFSQPSQVSVASSGADGITALENQYVFPELGETELSQSIIDCSDPSSQPEAKRRRLDDVDDDNS